MLNAIAKHHTLLGYAAYFGSTFVAGLGVGGYLAYKYAQKVYTKAEQVVQTVTDAAKKL